MRAAPPNASPSENERSSDSGAASRRQIFSVLSFKVAVRQEIRHRGAALDLFDACPLGHTCLNCAAQLLHLHAQYWADRRGKRLPQMGFSTMRLIRKQLGCCPICEDYLLHADQEPQSPQEWAKWFATIGKAMTRQLIVSPDPGRQDERRRLVHTSCLRRSSASTRSSQPSNASTPQRPA